MINLSVRIKSLTFIINLDEIFYSKSAIFLRSNRLYYANLGLVKSFQILACEKFRCFLCYWLTFKIQIFSILDTLQVTLEVTLSQSRINDIRCTLFVTYTGIKKLVFTFLLLKIKKKKILHLIFYNLYLL